MLPKSLRAFPVLITARLTLRQLSETDAPEIFQLRSNKAVNQYLDRKPGETEEEALHFIKTIKKNELLYWAIAPTDSEKLIGTICLFDLSDELHKCEIGYELLPGYQGQGFMMEAIKTIIEFAFGTLGVKTIEAFTHKDNQPSTKLLQKFDFEETGAVDAANPPLLLFRLSR